MVNEEERPMVTMDGKTFYGDEAREVMRQFNLVTFGVPEVALIPGTNIIESKPVDPAVREKWFSEHSKKSLSKKSLQAA
jgi:hypothetical protein